MPKEITVKSVLNKTKKRDAWFLDDYTLNLYSSCAFNCLYCYIRGSKYGTNLETSISVKINALDRLEQQLRLRAQKKEYGFIVLSSATDPYLKIEKEYELTRAALKLIAEYRFPVHIMTKSDLILRDLDLLTLVKERAILPSDLRLKLDGVILTFSFSTLDNQVAGIFEPGATAPTERLKALRICKTNGFKTGVSLMPLLPFISDTTDHLSFMYETFKAMECDYVLPATLTLFGSGKADSKTLMLNAIKKHYPDLELKYIKYFGQGTEMPQYYQKAFHQKMKEMGEAYGLKNSII